MEEADCHSWGGHFPRRAWWEVFVPSGSTNTCIHPAEGCALCVPLDFCMELTVDSDMAEKLWAWTNGQGSIVGVDYKPPSQENDTS